MSCGPIHSANAATYAGGTYQCELPPQGGCGTAFEVTPTVGGGWTETVLHDFGSGADGQNPIAGLIFDALGNLYGATPYGGNFGNGTVFELTPVHPCTNCSPGGLR